MIMKDCKIPVILQTFQDEINGGFAPLTGVWGGEGHRHLSALINVMTKNSKQDSRKRRQ